MKRLYPVWLFLTLCLLTLFLHAEPRGYAPIIRNDLNTSAYDWNALNTQWVNMRALGLVGIDASHFYQKDTSRRQVGDMSHYDRWDVRGLRIGAAGTINLEDPWTYLVSGSINTAMQDYNKSSQDPFTLLDCMVGIPLWGAYGRMQLGKMKEPISMERTMGMVFEQVMERPMHLDALLPTRNIGISFSDLLFEERLTWHIGAFNDWMEESHTSFSHANYQLIGRVTFLPYEESQKKELLHLGFSYRYESIREGHIRYDVGPEFYFSSPWLDTGTFAADASHTFNLEFTYMKGPLWIASEYTGTKVTTPSSGSHFFGGYHISANYFLTGEHRGYNKRRGTVRRITPVLDFDKGGWGAMELSARYSYLNLSDKEIEGGKMDILSAGVIWHPRRDHQFHLQWSRAHLKRTTPLSSIEAGESHTSMLQVRWVWMID